MNSKTIIFSILLISVILLSGCTGELSDEGIQAKLIEANTNLKSYSMDMKTELNMNMEMMGQKMDIKSEIDAQGKVDRINKKMSLKGTIKTDTLGMKMEMDMGIYAIDNYLYTKTMNVWIKQELNNDIWSSQDQIDQTIELVESGTIKRGEDESFNGNSYYVVNIRPDLKKVVEMALEEQQQSDLINQNMNFEDIIRAYASTIWINKKTFVMEKVKTDMKMVMTPENMGKEDMEEVGEIVMDINVEATMSDIDKEFTITLPEEASDAIDMTKMQEDSSKDVKGISSVTGNVISEAFD